MTHAMTTAIDESVSIIGLTARSENDAGCIGTARPVIHWKLRSDRQAVEQKAYQVQIARDRDFKDIVALSDPVAASFPSARDWPCAPLASRELRWVRIRVWTERGVTRWSDALRIEAALLSQDDWTARPISPLSNCDRLAPGPVPLLRRSFRIDKPVAQARLYVTSLGIHETSLNGAAVSDAELEPGWTVYQDRLLYSAFDLTPLLRTGENVLAAAVGDGWWRGWLTWMERRAVYGPTTAYLAQLEILYTDGSQDIIATDESWRGGTGDVLSADLYDGSHHDLRLGQEGWRHPGFDDSRWEDVRALALPVGLELRAMPPVRVVQSWSAIPVATGPQRWIVDTGQNLAGYLRIGVSDAAGATVTVRHAEVLDDDGALYTAPLRNAKATDVFILADDPAAILKPDFTFHGFRYAEILSDRPIILDRVEVCALSTDLPQIGAFECSEARINQLYQNVRWSQIGNFIALPTDCPQRDERLGWTGDIQVFADTACMNADAAPFLASWLRDLALDQRADGNVTSTVPNVISGHEFEYGGVGWGDAASLVPWSVYCATGDVTILDQQFDSMRRWVDYGASRRDADGNWTGDFHLGDWLDPGAPVDQPEKATTDSDFIATAYLSHSAGVVARAAHCIGKNAAALVYKALSTEVAASAWARWRDHLVTTQAGCAMALQFNIVPEEQRDEIGRTLKELVDRNDGRIATGFLGTPLVLPALTRTGQTETAYKLLLNEKTPGWLYQIKHGATTMWERWDAVKENGSLHAGEMSSGGGSSMISFNHYAYGAVSLWLYQAVAGIAPDPETPGYEAIRFAPKPGGGLQWARASVDTPFGLATISWAMTHSGILDIDIIVPPGAMGTFEVPESWALNLPDDRTALTRALCSGRHKMRLVKISP